MIIDLTPHLAGAIAFVLPDRCLLELVVVVVPLSSSFDAAWLSLEFSVVVAKGKARLSYPCLDFQNTKDHLKMQKVIEIEFKRLNEFDVMKVAPDSVFPPISKVYRIGFFKSVQNFTIFNFPVNFKSSLN